MASRTTKWRERNEEVLGLINYSVNTPEEIECERVDDHCSDMSQGVDADDTFSNADTFEDREQYFDLHDFSSDDSSFNTNFNSNNFLSEIANWAARFNVTHSFLNGLMHILRKHVDKDLPGDARIFLKTQRTVPVITKCGREYTYIGISEAISKQPIDKDKSEISLFVNIDGLPLFKSSHSDF